MMSHMSISRDVCLCQNHYGHSSLKMYLLTNVLCVAYGLMQFVEPLQLGAA